MNQVLRHWRKVTINIRIQNPRLTFWTINFILSSHVMSLQNIPPVYRNVDDINITREGVRRLLNNLKVHKAPGPDGITLGVLKQPQEPIASVLTTIFVKSYESGDIPEDWRKASVFPIFKKGAKSDPSNYRPICLTCICCKLLEHVITSSIMHTPITISFIRSNMASGTVDPVKPNCWAL